jgi:quercetin dioxygenase-like cupin family protein
LRRRLPLYASWGVQPAEARLNSTLNPGPSVSNVLAYVAEGEFWYLVDGQPEKIYKVGESFQLPHSAIHNEGSAGSNPVKVMVVFIVEKGKPLVQPAQ